MKNEIIEKAQAIMTSRRMKAISENEARIAEINQKLPQIKEINDAIYNSGKQLIAMIAGNDKGDIKEKIEKLKRDNLGAQAMAKRILVSNGYPEDYLDTHFHCSKCNDTGYIKDRFCDCFKKVCGKLASDELNHTADLELSSFDTFSLSYYEGDDFYNMKRIYEFLKQYADTFYSHSESLLMIGRSGLGKTHLSLAIANIVLQKGYSVVYDSAINILRSIEKEHFSREHSSEMIDLVMNTELLILDDLGAEYETSFNSSTIYNIINTRLNAKRPVIINTNLNIEGIRRRYEERVVSRITAYKCFEFRGKDVRLQISNEKAAKKGSL